MINEFKIGKIYKTNSVVGTSKQMLNPGTIVTVLNIETRTATNYTNYYGFADIETCVSILVNGQILRCIDWGDRLLNYFNEINEQ